MKEFMFLPIHAVICVCVCVCVQKAPEPNTLSIETDN